MAGVNVPFCRFSAHLRLGFEGAINNWSRKPSPVKSTWLYAKRLVVGALKSV